RNDETVLATVQGVRDGAREPGDREHSEQRQKPVDEVVGVEAGRVEREARPGPDDREKEREVAREPRGRGIRAEGRRNLGDRGDEDEIEEQLEPGRTTLFVDL